MTELKSSNMGSTTQIKTYSKLQPEVEPSSRSTDIYDFCELSSEDWNANILLHYPIGNIPTPLPPPPPPSKNKSQVPSPPTSKDDSHVISVQNSFSDDEFDEGNQSLTGIDNRSIGCLETGRLLNDTIVDYYMDYLLNQSTYKEQFHLFNTFFYKKCSYEFKTLEDPCDKFFKKWDKDVKIFDKNYLVIPVCERYHWVLVIVCHAHRLPINIKSRKQESYFMIMDSLSHGKPEEHGGPSSFSEPIRNFLNKRWLYERPGEGRPNFFDSELLKEIHAKVPRQTNSYDCGIHILNSFEQFIKNPCSICFQIKCGADLGWWKTDTEKKRNEIKALLRKGAL